MARASTSASSIPPIGCGTIASLPVSSSASPSSRARGSKDVVQIVSVDSPRCSSSIESWTLHDVQDPQSPVPVTTRRHSAAMRSASASPAPVAAWAFS